MSNKDERLKDEEVDTDEVETQEEEVEENEEGRIEDQGGADEEPKTKPSKPQRATSSKPKSKEEKQAEKDRKFLAKVDQEVRSSEHFVVRDYDNQTKLMLEVLNKQPKLPVQIPLNGEKVGSVMEVGINGAFFLIKKGALVMVPQSIAHIVYEHQQITPLIGQDHLITADQERMDALT